MLLAMKAKNMSSLARSNGYYPPSIVHNAKNAVLSLWRYGGDSYGEAYDEPLLPPPPLERREGYDHDAPGAGLASGCVIWLNRARTYPLVTACVLFCLYLMYSKVFGCGARSPSSVREESTTDNVSGAQRSMMALQKIRNLYQDLVREFTEQEKGERRAGSGRTSTPTIPTKGKAPWCKPFDVVRPLMFRFGKDELKLTRSIDKPTMRSLLVDIRHQTCRYGLRMENADLLCAAPYHGFHLAHLIAVNAYLMGHADSNIVQSAGGGYEMCSVTPEMARTLLKIMAEDAGLVEEPFEPSQTTIDAFERAIDAATRAEAYMFRIDEMAGEGEENAADGEEESRFHRMCERAMMRDESRRGAVEYYRDVNARARVREVGNDAAVLRRIQYVESMPSPSEPVAYGPYEARKRRGTTCSELSYASGASNVSSKSAASQRSSLLVDVAAESEIGLAFAETVHAWRDALGMSERALERCASSDPGAYDFGRFARAALASRSMTARKATNWRVNFGKNPEYKLLPPITATHKNDEYTVERYCTAIRILLRGVPDPVLNALLTRHCFNHKDAKHAFVHAWRSMACELPPATLDLMVSHVYDACLRV